MLDMRDFQNASHNGSSRPDRQANIRPNIYYNIQPMPRHMWISMKDSSADGLRSLDPNESR